MEYRFCNYVVSNLVKNMIIKAGLLLLLYVIIAASSGTILLDYLLDLFVGDQSRILPKYLYMSFIAGASLFICYEQKRIRTKNIFIYKR